MPVSLKNAEKARDEIMKSQLNEIRKLYNNWADEIGEKAKYYKNKNIGSSAISEKQMKELKKMLKAASEKIADEVNNNIKSGILKVSQNVVKINQSWLKSLGFPKELYSIAFSNVPDMIVRNIITGNIYNEGWSLSKSIWGDNEDTLKKIYEIVAKGQAENLPIYEVAKALENYVNPEKKKGFNKVFEYVDKTDGKLKTYRVYPKEVDYCAQRLARTLMQHSYQQSVIATIEKNPFAQKVKWHSTGSRVCEICKARDGKIYNKNNVPLDHPNGMCILEPIFDDDMDDRLIAWAKGKSKDKKIDEFAKSFGWDGK